MNIKINGDRFKNDIQNGFEGSLSKLSTEWLGRNKDYISSCCSRNCINEDDFIALCNVLELNQDDYKIVEDHIVIDGVMYKKYPPLDAKKETFVNLTPHDVVVCDREYNPYKCFRATGKVARINENINLVEVFGGVSLYRHEYREVLDLPDPVPGTRYIVSGVVRRAFPERKDLVTPNKFVKRPGSEVIVGCRSFITN